MPDFLLEVGAEELPASYIEPALTQMSESLAEGLADARLTGGKPRVAATPRRLVLWVPDLPARQTDIEVEVSGPPASVAFGADGKPTRAAMGFAKAQGVPVDRIVRLQTPRGEYCAVRKLEKGRDAKDILGDMLPAVLSSASFPKSMLWPETDSPFARPIRWIVALFGEEVVQTTAYGVSSDRLTEAHPFLKSGRISIETADWEAYREALRRASVLVDVDERRNLIREQIENALSGFGGCMQEHWLLEEVTQLTQFPHVIVGRFAPEFLQVPSAVVVAAMTEHQRYFPVRNAEGGLCANFLVVSDRGKGGTDTIRHGNERVLHARLADARFFYEQDRARRLEEYVDATEGMVFLKGLGTYRQKTQRLSVLVSHVCDALGCGGDARQAAIRAAELCKADLVTAMVGEFPKLQGVVGRIYADGDGESVDVGRAIVEHYMPRYAGDELPASEAGRALGLAEKMDNLCGCFSLGLLPSGSADPYALRRQSQAMLRIIEDSGRFLQMTPLVRTALNLLPEGADTSPDTEQRILAFLRDRLQQLALERGIPHDLVRAALAVKSDCIVDFWLRVNTLRALSDDPMWPGFVEVAERTFNISRGMEEGGDVNADLFDSAEERSLWDLLGNNEEALLGMLRAREYEKACRQYADRFAGPVHAFFENVFVNVEDAAIRNNRLALLRRISDLMLHHVANLSQITTGIDKG